MYGGQRLSCPPSGVLVDVQSDIHATRGDAFLRVQHVGWTTFFLSTERGTGGCTKRHPPYEGRCFLTSSARRVDNVFLSTERGTGGCTKRHPPYEGRCFLTSSARRVDNVFLSTERGTGGCTQRQ